MAERIGLPKIELQEGTTKRPINPGAEKWLGEPIPLLDHGFLYLVDYMGNDGAVEQAARVSYGSGTRAVSATRGLIRYLYSHHHTTPFEMAEMKFHAKMPIFVARQWVRHRTANINEYSGRYSILSNEFYIPEPSMIASQSKNNRQGRNELFDAEEAAEVRNILFDDAKRNYEHYQHMLNDDGDGNPVDEERGMLARELARMNLTMNSYTEWYWKCDLHNILHFLQLRMDKHAQQEIRVYADAMAQIVESSFPLTWEAFNDYAVEAIRFSGPEKKVIGNILGDKAVTKEEADLAARKMGMTSKREIDDFTNRLDGLGLIR